MDTEPQDHTNALQPGMKVVSTRGDLGEQDMSEPVVAKVVRDQQNNVETVVVKKGLIFTKEFAVPADRVQDVVEHSQQGKTAIVSVDVDEVEAQENASGLLEMVEEAIPTAEGLRE